MGLGLGLELVVGVGLAQPPGDERGHLSVAPVVIEVPEEQLRAEAATLCDPGCNPV